jgi:acyl-CoA thioester hydrolase
MKPYVHTVQYYETDRMGIVHHSNYVRWMEEARVDFLARIGFPFGGLEERGFFSPVTSVSCEYKRPCTFGDEVLIRVSVGSFNGAVVKFLYEMEAPGGALLCRASSEHVFTDRSGRVLRLRRSIPDFAAALDGLLAGSSASGG